MADQAPVSTLPSAGVLESTTPPPPPPAHPGKKPTMGAALAALPSGTDAAMAHLLRCLQTRAGADVVLQFACYSARLSGSVLDSLSRRGLRHSAQQLVAMAFQLPPQTSVVLATAPAPRVAAAAMRLGGQMGALSALLGEARTVNRLWGLLGLYFGLKRLAVAPKSSTGRAASLVAYTQLLLLVCYQVFENMSFLASKKVIRLDPAVRARMALWSVKCWGGWIAVELARLVVERWRRSGIAGGDGDDEKELAVEREKEWSDKWTRSFLRNLAWAPVVVHWCLPQGLLPDLAVSLLAMYPSTSQMLDLWGETA